MKKIKSFIVTPIEAHKVVEAEKLVVDLRINLLLILITMNDLLLSSSDCAFLCSFHQHGSVSELCVAKNLDKGFVSRKLTKLAALAPVLVKVRGRWKLTQQGLDIVTWYQEAAARQRQLLQEKQRITIGSTQLISATKIVPVTNSILRKTGLKGLSVLTETKNTEESLFSSEIDFALVCAIPHSPEIRYKRVFKSPYVIVMPYEWKEPSGDVKALLGSAPYVAHTGIDLRSLLQIEDVIPQPACEFDHLTGVREAVIQKLGWALLPLYAVENDLKAKRLRQVELPPSLQVIEEFYFWWLPEKWERKFVNQLIDFF